MSTTTTTTTTTPQDQGTNQEQTKYKIPTEEELKEKWNHFSRLFDHYMEPSTNITGTTMASFIIGYRRRTIDEHKEQKCRVLEIGCGAGGLSKILGTQLDDDVHVTSVDISPEMLKLAREKNQHHVQSGKVDFVEGSAQHLPFEDHSFDFVVSNYCLHLIPDPDEGFKEIYRVMKNGGRLLASVWGRKENSPKFTIPPKVLTDFCHQWNMTHPDSNNPNPVRSPFHLSDKNSTKHRVEAAGFDKVLTWYQREPTYAMNGEEFAHIFIHGMPLMKDFHTKLSSEHQDALYKLFVEEADQYMKEHDEVISNEVLMISAQK